MATWKVFGQQLFTADMGAQTYSQRFKLPHKYLLLSVKTWIIFYNNPTFTDLKLELWSDDGGVPRAKLHTSASVAKADILSLQNGVREVYFNFNAPAGVPIQKSDWYHLVINGSGYTGDATAHIAWMKAFPDPAYSTNYTPTFENLSIAPYAMTFVGGRF